MNEEQYQWDGKKVAVEWWEIVPTAISDMAPPMWWSRSVIGQTRQAAKVTTRNGTFWVDNQDGAAHAKLTSGGYWQSPHRGLDLLSLKLVRRLNPEEIIRYCPEVAQKMQAEIDDWLRRYNPEEFAKLTRLREAAAAAAARLSHSSAGHLAVLSRLAKGRRPKR